MQLIVQVYAVNLKQEGRVSKRGLAAKNADEKRHRKRLARTGRVLDDAEPFVRSRLDDGNRLLRGELYGKELMILRALLCDFIVRYFKQNEIAYVSQQALFRKQAFDERFHAARRVGFYIETIYANQQ